MQSEKVNLFMATNSKYFDTMHLMMIKQKLEEMPDDKFVLLQSISYKDPTMLLIVSILAGGLGIDRFLLGQVGLGVAKLLTCGGMGIWSIVDWFMIMGVTKETNFRKFMESTMF